MAALARVESGLRPSRPKGVFGANESHRLDPVEHLVFETVTLHCFKCGLTQAA